MSYLGIVEDITIIGDDDLDIAKVGAEDFGVVSITFKNKVITTLDDWKDLSKCIEAAIHRILKDEERLKCRGIAKSE